MAETCNFYSPSNWETFNKVEFEKSSEFICLTYEDVPRSQGTEIVLDYDQFFSIFQNTQNVEAFVKKNFIDCNIPISMITSKEGKTTPKLLELQKAESIYPDSIKLDDYFDGIQAAMQFNYKGITYLREFSDIYAAESYIFQEKNDEIVLEEELIFPVLLKDYVVNGVVKFLTLPIITTSEEDNFGWIFAVLRPCRKLGQEEHPAPRFRLCHCTAKPALLLCGNCSFYGGYSPPRPSASSKEQDSFY